MVVVSPPGAHPLQPGASPALVLAKRAFDSRMNEDPIHDRIGGRRFDQARHAAVPGGQELAGAQVHHDGRHGRPAWGSRLGRWSVPEVDIEPVLVAAMAGWRGPSARLAQIAHAQQAQVFAARAGREIAQVGHQRRMAELAVPFRMLDHPASAAQGQGDRALHATGSGLTDGARRTRPGSRNVTPAGIENSNRRL